MSAELSETFRAREGAQEALSRCVDALKCFVAHRLEAAEGILSECERALMQAGLSGEALDLSFARSDIHKLIVTLVCDEAAEGADESEVDDADD